MTLAWRLRGAVPPRLRPYARRLVDRVASPVSSLNGAHGDATTVGLTFDDGPDPAVTPAVLDLLDEFDARATFFVLTDKVAEHRDIVLETVARGHEIALHGDRHDRMTTFDAGVVRDRLAAAKDLLESVVQREVRLYRPPFGAQSLRTYRSARSCGLDVVVWGPYAGEWQGGTPRDMADRAQQGRSPGTIVLMHDGLEVPAGDVVPDLDRARGIELILADLQAEGLAGSSVSGLLDGGPARRTVWFRP